MESFVSQPTANAVGCFEGEAAFLFPSQTHGFSQTTMFNQAAGWARETQFRRGGDELGAMLFNKMFFQFGVTVERFGNALLHDRRRGGGLGICRRDRSRVRCLDGLRG